MIVVDLIINYGTILPLAALKRMLNFNAPPLKNTAAEPVWKVRDFTPALYITT